MTRDAFTLCAQIGRLWAASSGKTFKELRSAVPAQIHAGSLPPRSLRVSPSAGITPMPIGKSDALSPTRTINIAIEARGDTPKAAMAMIEEIQTILFADHQPRMGPTFGVPPAAIGGEADLWRVVNMQTLSHPVLLITGNATTLSVEGEAVATLSITAMAVEDTAIVPSIAGAIYYSGDAATATMQVTGSAVLITIAGETGISIAFSLHTTWGAVRAQLAAIEGIVLEDIDASLDARASADLVVMAASSIKGEINRRDLALVVED